MDLFENPVNGNNKYVRPQPDVCQQVVIPELEKTMREEVVDQDDEGEINLSILSRDVIEVHQQFRTIQISDKMIFRINVKNKFFRNF